MYSFKELQHIVDTAIKKSVYPGYLPELYDPITYIMSLEGKRLRPCLVLMGCNLFSEDIGAAVNPALSVELFHNFTLMHDDIMDKAPLRRGAPTVHRKWNPNTAILSGDVMLVEAYKLMAKVSPGYLEKVLDIFSRTAALVCEGQQLDMNFEKQELVNIQAYLQMIELKTAVLLGASLKIGAVTGGAANHEAEELYGFGKNLGIAFQLQDDYLDLYGNPEKFGKQVGGDVLANKKTYLLIKAFELAGPEEEKTLRKWLRPDAPRPEEKVSEVKKVFDALGIPEKIREETALFTSRAFTHLDQVAVPAEKKYILCDFAEKLLRREK
ncbi:geranylgeranyl diphosphate synthase type II [Anseongella ginsenosidimutans]|uniref:Geranylgeranyl diphosphate synthase type II n=1 Tax=Anseongella ginsenosidimutans TaxID=496056 RepID=A0A4R3KS26_9SPHI|nr:polyprenyl synthetase family protein [Anseongella ginsenosidimutans]QEC53147.1 polyprenyl synthetase family protein [Anseongella ginsenosidimutans]TCS87770.1 geranylgeranyl diphosphate synthase type II [Anseongella ginsenosidimutans]